MTPPVLESSPYSNKGVFFTLFFLSAATLAFEVNLTRLFSVAQFYHFAFMIVSTALLGFGASGTALIIFPALLRGDPRQRMLHLALLTGFSMLGAYLLTNYLPFDSFSLLVNRWQVWILILHYLALAAPFFFSGLALGYLLTKFPASAGTTYAVNLLGSAAGCVLALLAPPLLGGAGMVSLSAALTAFAAALPILRTRPVRLSAAAGASALLIFTLFDIGSRFSGGAGIAALALHISPYKSLSYALQYPRAAVIQQSWNAFSRVDLVRSGGIHSVPGLSYRYLQPLPSMDGLLVDGDDLNPVPRIDTDSAFTAYLPGAVAYQLRPQGAALILEPRGGLDILTAVTLSSGKVTAMEVNPLIIAAAPIYSHPRVDVFAESERSFLQRTQAKYDVVMLSLTSSYHPVQSGAYTLAEDYRYTVESFDDVLAHLNSDGLLVATRWLQNPPSEDLRLFALAVSALESSGGDPRSQIASFRGYNTATDVIKNSPFTAEELSEIRDFTAQRAFDLTYLPGIRSDETNKYNILPDSVYYQTYLQLLNANPREAFYANYEFDVRPPSDDQPFFGHYFKWAQTPQILAELGKSWQPFGGAGYFVILALLILAVFTASLLILAPVLILKRSRPDPSKSQSPFLLRNLVYFGLLGFAFLFVEIPLLQRFILYLGQPAYAITAVLFSLLLFSGIGSRLSRRIPLLAVLAALFVLILAAPLLLPPLFSSTLGFPLTVRLGITALCLAPLGFLMGIPFPAGIRILISGQSQSQAEEPDRSISWIWAVNGAASVIAPILAALLALSFGFSSVLRVGALCYAGALITALALLRPGAVRRLAR